MRTQSREDVTWSVIAAPPTTLLSRRSAALCCQACRMGFYVCLVFEAGRSLVKIAASYLLSCLPFLSCLPPLICASGMTGSAGSLSQQRLLKEDSLENQTVVKLKP